MAEEEWLEIVTNINLDIFGYGDFVEAASLICAKFKEEKCDLIVALTHMSWRNDKKLAESIPEIDLILGGHDHIVQ